MLWKASGTWSSGRINKYFPYDPGKVGSTQTNLGIYFNLHVSSINHWPNSVRTGFGKQGMPVEIPPMEYLSISINTFLGDASDLNDGALSSYCLFLYLSLLVEIEIELKQNSVLFTLANTFVKYQYKPLKMINWVIKIEMKKCKITVYLGELKEVHKRNIVRVQTWTVRPTFSGIKFWIKIHPLNKGLKINYLKIHQ